MRGERCERVDATVFAIVCCDLLMKMESTGWTTLMDICLAIVSFENSHRCIITVRLSG